MKTYELTLLSPLYYRSKIESGAAGATVTSPWIGDIAITYAINNALGLKQIPFGYTSHRPNYREIISLGFLSSILEPVSDCRYTKVFDIATSFMSEGYPQGKAISDSGRAPMRNWTRRQGLEPGNSFSFMVFFRDGEIKFPERFTVRLGNTRECLAVVKEESNNKLKNVTINLYTLSLVLGERRFNEIVSDIKTGEYSINVEQASSQYILAKGIPIEYVSKFFTPYV